MCCFLTLFSGCVVDCFFSYLPFFLYLVALFLTLYYRVVGSSAAPTYYIHKTVVTTNAVCDSYDDLYPKHIIFVILVVVHFLSNGDYFRDTPKYFRVLFERLFFTFCMNLRNILESVKHMTWEL